VIFDPRVVSLETVMRRYFSRAGSGGRTEGQYRAEVFPTSEEQAERIRNIAEPSTIPLAEAGSAEAKFWSAEAYHQKYRLRRKTAVVDKLAEGFGPRWDEHAYATKLNAAGQPDFDVEVWLKAMPLAISDAFRREF